MSKAGRSMRETQTKAERMVEGGLYSFGSKIGARIASILNSIIIVRTLGLYDLGVLSIVLLILSIGSVTSSLGIPQAIVKFLSGLPPGHHEEASNLIGGGLVLALAGSALTSVVLIAASPTLATVIYSEPLIAVLLPISVIALFFSAGLSPAVATIQAHERIRDLGLREIVASVLSVPVTVGFVLYLGLLGAIIASVTNSVIGIIVRIKLLGSIWRQHGLSLRLPSDRSVYKKLANYGLPAMIAGLLVTPAQLVANTLLTLHASFAQLGVYAVGLSLASYLFFIPDSIGLPFVPLVSRLTRDHPSDLPTFLLSTLRIGTFLLLPPTIVVIMFPEWILTLIFGPKVIQAVAVARLLAAAVFFAGIAGIVGHAISGIGRTWDGLAINLVWGALFLLLSFLLVPTWKEIGLASAFLAAYSIHYAITLGYASKRWSIRIQQFAPSSLMAAGFLGLALVLSTITPAPNLAIGGAVLGALGIVELVLMSRREREVLSLPLRRLLGWLEWSE